MSDSAIAAGEAHHEHPTNTGIPNKKIAMWAFLSSDCMFFGTLISTHLIYRRLNPDVVDPTQLFDIPLLVVATLALLFSSFFMAIAVSSMHKGNMAKARNNIGIVIVLGVTFLACLIYEYMHLAHLGLTPWENIYGSTFFVLTGIHGIHVTFGLVWLIAWFFYALSGRLAPQHAIDIESTGLYWHFVELVWVILVTVVYLIEYL